MSLLPSLKPGFWNAWLFMSVFILQMIAIGFADQRVREKTHVPSAARTGRYEKMIGIIGNVVWLSAVGLSIFLPLRSGTIWFYLGLWIFLVGLIMMGAATANFISTPADQLIRTGAYRISRHPMYAATFFICLGSGLASASWMFVLLSVILAICFSAEARIEERYCSEKYGAAYQEYMRRSPRWIGMPKK